MRLQSSSNGRTTPDKLPRAVYKLTIQSEPSGAVSRKGNRTIKVVYKITEVCVDDPSRFASAIGTTVIDYIVVEPGNSGKLEKFMRSLGINIEKVEFNDVTGEPMYLVDDITGEAVPLSFTGKELYAVCESVAKPMLDEFGNPLRAPNSEQSAVIYIPSIVSYL